MVDLSRLPQVNEWMFGVRSFDLRSFLQETSTIAEACSVVMLVWPEFVEYRGCVLLKWAFSATNVDRWFDELNGDVPAIEAVLNHLHLWDVFTLNGAEEYAAASAFARHVAPMWKAALRMAYPDREFEVTVTDEPDDYGPTLTFRSC